MKGIEEKSPSLNPQSKEKTAQIQKNYYYAYYKKSHGRNPTQILFAE
jgi:hypothetical protein